MNYYIKKDLSKIVRAKKCSSAFFAMRQGLTVPAIKKEGYMVETASTTTSGLVTREFLSVFEFESNYDLTDISTLDVTAIGTMITSFLASDITRPTVASTIPANAATLVATDTAVSITFNEAIAVIEGKVGAFYHVVEGEWVKIEDARSMTVGGAGNKTLTMTHLAFTNYEVIRVVLPADSIEDASANGNNYNTAYQFQFTTIPEQTVVSVPVDNATGIVRTSNLTATYLNALNDATSTFAITVTAGGAAVASTVTYDTAKKVVTINPDATLAAETEFTLTCHAIDTAGQVKDDVITFTTAA